MAYKILPPSQFVTVTWAGETAQTEQDTSRAIQSALIQRIDTDALGSRLTVVSPDGAQGMLSYTVTQSPAAIAALTGIHILLTPTDTTLDAFYANVCVFRGGIIDMTSVPFGGNYRTVYLDFGTVQTLNVSESAASLVAALNAAGGATPADVTVAAAGTNQATAATFTAVDGKITRVLVTGVNVGGGAYSVILPVVTDIGTQIVMSCTGAAGPLSVWPQVGGAINGLGVNTAYPLDLATGIIFVYNGTNTWSALADDNVVSLSDGSPTSPSLHYENAPTTGTWRDPGTGTLTHQVVLTSTFTEAQNGDGVGIVTASQILNRDLEPVELAGGATVNSRNSLTVVSSNDGDPANEVEMYPYSERLVLANPVGVRGLMSVTGATVNGIATALDFPANCVVELSAMPVSPDPYTAPFTKYSAAIVSSIETDWTSAAVAAQNVSKLLWIDCNIVPALNGATFTISQLARGFVVKNDTAFYADIFPPAGGTINGLGVNATIRVYPGSTITFVSKDGLTWTITGTRKVVGALGTAITDTNVAATSVLAHSFTAAAATTTVQILTTIVAATSIQLDGYDAAGAAVGADVRAFNGVITY